jgi:phosphopantetheinyl transferase
MVPKHYIDGYMRLHTGAVHIWRADLDNVAHHPERLLDERERERAARIMREPARSRWIASRGALRALLASYTGEAPSRLRLGVQGGGKPVLEPPWSRRELHFSLSHSGGQALYAVTEMCAVGIDLELVERRSGEAHSRGRRQELRGWVRREAEGKRLGAGVMRNPLEKARDPHQEARSPAQAAKNPHQRAQAGDRRSWIAELDLGAEAIAAIALERAPVDFQVYALDFRACGSILPTNTHGALAN